MRTPKTGFGSHDRQWGSLGRWQAHRDQGRPTFPHWRLERSRRRRGRSVAAYADTGRHLAEPPLSRFAVPLLPKPLYVPGKPAQWPALSSMIGGSINTKIIEQQLGEILRLAASIQQGTVTASLILRKLGSYPRQNSLALALREIGRIERTLFMVAWLEDPALRRRVPQQSNFMRGGDRIPA